MKICLNDCCLCHLKRSFTALCFFHANTYWNSKQNSDAWSSVWAYVLEWYDYVNWAFNSVIVRNAYDAMYSHYNTFFHWEKEMHTLSHKEDPNLQICWIEWWPGFDWPLKTCIWLTTLKVDCQWHAFSVTDTLKVDCQWLAFSCEYINLTSWVDPVVVDGKLKSKNELINANMCVLVGLLKAPP